MAGALLLASLARADDADAGVAAFLRHVYGAYSEPPSAPDALKDAAAIGQVFSQRLASLLIRSQRLGERTHSTGCLLSDPLIEAQDWEISDFKVETKAVGPDAAAATVSFMNLGQSTIIEFALVKSAATWRIDDVRSARRGRSLRATLAACLANAR